MSKIIDDAKAALQAYEDYDSKQDACGACGSIFYKPIVDGKSGPRIHRDGCLLKIVQPMVDVLQAMIDAFDRP